MDVRQKEGKCRDHRIVGLEPVSLVITVGRLRWFWLAEFEDDADWVKCCTTLEIGWNKALHHMRKTWWDCQGRHKERDNGKLCGWLKEFRCGWKQNLMKKVLREMQTLHAGCSKVKPKFFALPQTPFPGSQDGQNLISWRWSLPLPANPVWWASMHTILSYLSINKSRLIATQCHNITIHTH